MAPQIPYAGLGIGIAVIFGVRLFLVAETVKERAFIAGIPVVIFLTRILLPSLAGELISLTGWILYGVGCVIYLRYNGMVIR